MIESNNLRRAKLALNNKVGAIPGLGFGALIMPDLGFSPKRTRRNVNKVHSRNLHDLLAELSAKLTSQTHGSNEHEWTSREVAPSRTEPTHHLAQLSAKIRHSAVLAERTRIARDFHDILAQGFTGVIIQLGAAEQALSRNLATEAASRINRACELAQESLRQTRLSIGGLRSQVLEEKNLCEALNESFQKMIGGTTLRANFTFFGQQRQLPREYEENLLRIGQEALTNTIRHARASEFKAELFFGEQEIRLLLHDNGCGFEPASRSEGFGLKGMSERVESLGGTFSVNSTKGAGTSISIMLQDHK